MLLVLNSLLNKLDTISRQSHTNVLTSYLGNIRTGKIK